MIWRYLLATVISILVIVLFQRTVQRPPQNAPRESDRIAEEQREGLQPRQGRQPNAEVGGAPPVSGEPPIRVRWNEGRLESLAVEMPGEAGSVREYEFLKSLPGGPGPLSIAVGSSLSRTAVDEKPGGEFSWDKLLVEDWEVVEDGADHWVHKAVVEERLQLLRTVTRGRIPADGIRRAGKKAHHLDVKLSFKNLGGEDISLRYRLYGAAGMRTDLPDAPGSDVYLAYGLRKSGDGLRGERGSIHVETTRSRTLRDRSWESRGVSGKVAWVGAYNSGCLAALYSRGMEGVPPTFVDIALASAAEIEASNFGVLSTAVQSVELTLKAGDSIENTYGFFAGERDPQTLAAYSTYRLADANIVDFTPSSRFRLPVNTGDGSLTGFYLRAFDKSVDEGGGADGRVDYELLRKPYRGPSLLSLEIFEQKEESDEQLGFATSPWFLKEGGDGDGGDALVLEKTVAEVLARVKIVAAPATDLYTTDGDVEQEALRDPEGAHHVNITLEIRNLGSADRSIFYRFYGPCGIDTEELRAPGYDIVFGHGAWSNVGDRVIAETLDTGDLEEGWEREGVAWLGLTNSYFATVFFPRPQFSPPRGEGGRAPFVDTGFAAAFPDPQSLRELAEEGSTVRNIDHLIDAQYGVLAEKSYKNVRTGFSSVALTLSPDSSVRHEYGLFAAPRAKESFARYSHLNFEGINDYGWLDSLVRFFIAILNGLKTVTFGSWGFAIVLLTVCVKLCLHPINRRSQRSIMRAQKKMQKVKPLMDEIKERYGKDRVAMQKEMQKLFQEHGINPVQQLGGCLMMFLQLPIWIGLYRTLQYAIGLRQAEFLYITDLTKPDNLFPFGFDLPILGDYFNLLPILYVILTLINQRLQPKPTDPQMQAQYKMMSLMMVVFGVIFFQFPSGFMLYIMTSSALGIVESKIIKAQLKREDDDLEKNSDSSAVMVSAYPSKSKAEKETPKDGAQQMKRRKRKKR